MNDDCFESAKQFFSRMVSRDFNVKMEEFGVEKRGFRFELDGVNTMGRFVLWETGECSLDVIDTFTDSEVLFENSVVNYIQEIEAKYEKFLSALKINTSNNP